MVQGTKLTNDTVVTFYYDTKGRFGGWKESMWPDSFAIVYPADPTKPVAADMAKYKLAKTEFFYDADKRLIKLIDRVAIFNFEYDAGGLITKITRTSHDGNGNPAGTPGFVYPQYDNNGNLISVSAWTATYSNLPNMFKGMEIFSKMTSFDLGDLAMGNDSYAHIFALCSKNMPATMKLNMASPFLDYDFTITYETDEHNNIIGSKSVSSGAGNENVTYTRKFEYEKK